LPENLAPSLTISLFAVKSPLTLLVAFRVTRSLALILPLTWPGAARISLDKTEAALKVAAGPRRLGHGETEEAYGWQ
jgi:hypothetical protein